MVCGHGCDSAGITNLACALMRYKFHAPCKFLARVWGFKNHAGACLTLFLHSVGVPAWKRLIDSLTSQERISLITDIFSDRHETEVAKRLCGEDAQSFAEVVYEMLDTLVPRLQSKCLGVLREICDRQALLPRSIKIQLDRNPSDTPLDQGGYTEAWKGQHQGCHVLVKVLRPKIYSTSDFEMVTSVGFRVFSRGVFYQLMFATVAVLQGGCDLERSSPSECVTVVWGDDW